MNRMDCIGSVKSAWKTMPATIEKPASLSDYALGTPPIVQSLVDLQRDSERRLET